MSKSHPHEPASPLLSGKQPECALKQTPSQEEMKLHELKKPCLFHSIHSVQPLLFVLLSNGEPFYLLSLLLYQPLSELTVRWYPPHLPYQMDDDKTRLESKLCQNIVALSTVFLGVLSGQLTDIPSAVVHVSAARRQIQ